MEVQVGFFLVFFLLLIRCASTLGVLQLHGWENTNIASILLVIVTKSVHHLCQKKSLFPFRMGMLSFIFFSYWKMREIQEPLLSNASCSEI